MHAINGRITYLTGLNYNVTYFISGLDISYKLVHIARRLYVLPHYSINCLGEGRRRKMTEATLVVGDSRPNRLPENMLSEHERLRVVTLQRLAEALRNFPVEAERAEFSRLFDRAQSVLEVDDTELARTLRVSRPTIGRWARGDSAPHPIGRGSVLLSLAEFAEAKLKHHMRYRKGVGAQSVA